MGFFRIPLAFNKKIGFWKLLGCGKNGTFDIHPDWRQWGILSVDSLQFAVDNRRSPIISHQLLYGSFISWWWKFFKCETYTILLESIEGHGKWDGKNIFGPLPKQTEYEGSIAVLTRATIRLSKLKQFWKHVDGLIPVINNAQGLLLSIGIGEIPLIKQATFSIWQSKEHMKQFAYKMEAHTEVIQKTRAENWYSEEMFVRFKVIGSFGTLRGNDPLQGKL